MWSFFPWPSSCPPAWGSQALREQLGRSSGSRTGELVLVAGVDLQPLSCGLPAPPGPVHFLPPLAFLHPCLWARCSVLPAHGHPFPAPWTSDFAPGGSPSGTGAIQWATLFSGLGCIRVKTWPFLSLGQSRVTQSWGRDIDNPKADKGAKILKGSW